MSKLLEFIQNKMRMSHIYQPVMIKTLLLENGTADKNLIAKKILEYDFSQVEYYENITNNMVGRVLRNHHIVRKENNNYILDEFENLSTQEIEEIIEVCDSKIEEYIGNRGKKIWEHRRRNRRAVPGSIRYKVLKRAKGRCELCGISKEERALEVDHITPNNWGGQDSLDNYQALCYTCNANKRDTDDTDFRNLNAFYDYRLEGCFFCEIDEKSIMMQNELALAFLDKYPVTKYHTLITPKRHCRDFFELSQAEINSMTRLSHQIKNEILNIDNSVQGFNIGYNVGEEAGQTIWHCHLHLIPRRKGDVDNPTGGVRNVIPEKGDYK